MDILPTRALRWAPARRESRERKQQAGRRGLPVARQGLWGRRLPTAGLCECAPMPPTPAPDLRPGATSGTGAMSLRVTADSGAVVDFASCHDDEFPPSNCLSTDPKQFWMLTGAFPVSVTRLRALTAGF